MRKVVGWVGILLAAGIARGQAQDQGDAQQQGAEATQPQGDAGPGPASAGGTATADSSTTAAGPSDAFDRACVDLLHGRLPPGEKAIRALRDACANLMAGRADDQIQADQRRQAQLAAREQLRLQAEGRVQPGQSTEGRVQPGQSTEGRVQPGQSTAAPEPGQGVLAAFGSAASELAGSNRTRAMGMRPRGPVGYTLVTNPVGWFSGLGMNVELFGAFMDAPKFSWVAGARYSEADATNGTASTFGGMAGADLFIIGRNNEGLRIGPRLELAAGRERFQGSTTFARLGMSGELGYNFIATNGITGLLAAGVGGRVAGNDKNDNFASFVGGEFGPYLKVGLGYSW